MDFLLNVLLFVGFAQGLLLSVALFAKRKANSYANRILAVLLFFFSFLILFHAMGHSHTDMPSSNVHQWFIHALFFTVAPLMFFYSKALTKYDFRLSLKDSLHFIPALVINILLLLLSNAASDKEFYTTVNRVILLLLTLQMFVYLTLMFIILRNHTKNIQNICSSLEKINLRWLRFFIFSQAVIWPVALAMDLSRHKTDKMGYLWLVVSIFMYLIGYFGFLQPEIFSGELKEKQISIPTEKKKYEKSTLSLDQAEAILQKLLAFMDISKPYMDSNLTLPALSKQISVSPHHLSQIINEKLNKNFFEFVNYFRVEEAKQLLKDPEFHNLTIAAIGFKAGFNSISSFNSIFKKLTSLTPSQYRLSDNSLPDTQ